MSSLLLMMTMLFDWSLLQALAGCSAGRFNSVTRAASRLFAKLGFLTLETTNYARDVMQRNYKIEV